MHGLHKDSHCGCDVHQLTHAEGRNTLCVLLHGHLVKFSLYLHRSLSRWYCHSMAVPKKPSSCEIPYAHSLALQLWTTAFRSPQRYIRTSDYYIHYDLVFCQFKKCCCCLSKHPDRYVYIAFDLCLAAGGTIHSHSC